MRFRAMAAIFSASLCLLVLSACMAHECTAQTVHDVLYDWDSLAATGSFAMDTEMIAEKDLRFLVQQEMQIMVTSKEYEALLQAVTREAAGASFFIRISERRDHHWPVDSFFIRNDTIIRVYGKPEPGSVEWIIGKPDGSTWLFYVKKGKVHKTKLDCREALLEGISSEEAGGYYPVGSFPNADLISIWTPTAKRHLFVTFLRGALRLDTYYMGGKIQGGLRTIARALVLHSCTADTSK